MVDNTNTKEEPVVVDSGFFDYLTKSLNTYHSTIYNRGKVELELVLRRDFSSQLFSLKVKEYIEKLKKEKS